MIPTLPSRLARRMSSAVRTKSVRSGRCSDPELELADRLHPVREPLVVSAAAVERGDAAVEEALEVGLVPPELVVRVLDVVGAHAVDHDRGAVDGRRALAELGGDGDGLPVGSGGHRISLRGRFTPGSRTRPARPAGSRASCGRAGGPDRRAARGGARPRPPTSPADWLTVVRAASSVGGELDRRRPRLRRARAAQLSGGPQDADGRQVVGGEDGVGSARRQAPRGRPADWGW